MKKIILILSLFCSLNSFAQSFIDLNTSFIELYKKGDYTAALSIGIKAVEQAKKEFGTSHINYAIAVHNVAETYYKLKKFNDALPYYQLAINSYTAATKEENIKDIALCNNNIGTIFLVNKLYDSAAYYLEKSYTFFIEHIDENYISAIGVMNNLGDLYLPLEQFENCKKAFIKILPAMEKKEGFFSTNYRTTYANLMYCLQQAKDYENLKIWATKLLPATTKKYGKISAEYAEINYQLGNAYSKLKQFDSSVYFYKEAYKAYIIVENTKPTNNIGFTANNIGLAYMELKQYDSSATYLEVSFDYFVKHAKDEYDNAAQIMENLEELYMPINETNKMVMVYQRWLPVVEAKHGIFEDNYFTVVNKISKIASEPNQLQNLQKQLVNLIEKFEVQKKITDNIWYAEYVYLLAKCYRNLEKNEISITTYNKAIALYNALSKGVVNKNISICNNDLGIIYLNMQKYDLSANFFQKAFDYFIKNNNSETDYKNLVVIGDNLVTVFNSNNRNLGIKKVCEQMLPIIELEETEVSENYSLFLYNLCSALRFVHDYIGMEKRVQELLTIRSKLNGENSLEFAEALDYSGLCQVELNNFVKAESELNRSFKIKKALGNKANKSIVLTYIALGNLKSGMGNYNAAYQYYGNAAKIYEQANDTENFDYITILQSWGYTYIEGSRYADAKEMLLKVLKLQSKFEGENFSRNAAVLVSIANAEFQLNELSAAQEHTQKAMFIANQNKGLLTDVIATAKSIFALLEHKMGNSIKGVELMQESVDLNKQLYGESSSRVALTYTTFSLIYQEIGRYADAELVLQKAMAIQKKIFGTKHPEYAMSLMNLAMVKTMQGGNEMAIDLLKESMNIYISKGLAGTSNFIKILSNLTFIVDKLGLYAEAKKLQLQTLGILDERKDTSSYIRYMIMNNLSTTCIRLNEFNESVQYSKKALSLIEKSQGKKSIEYIKSSNNLILGYRKLGNIAVAKELTKEQLVLCKEVLGNDAELLATIYFNEAIFANEENNYKASAGYLEKTTQILFNNFKQNFYTLSEKEKLAWWQEKDYIFAFYPSLLIKYPEASNEIVESYVNTQLQIKGFVLSDATVALRRARTNGDKELVKLIDDWQSARTLLSKQLSLPIVERYYNVDSIAKIVNNSEKIINQKAAGVISIQENNVVNCKVIQASLKVGEAAIEFVRFPFYRFSTYTDTVRYAAIIIQKNQPPKFVSIGTEDQIKWCLTGGKNNTKETRVNSLYRSSINKSGSAETFAGDSLYSIIWKPLMPYLNNINSIAYSPDGLLHKVAFNALPMVPKEKLLIDEFRLNQYSSVRQVAAKSTQVAVYNSMFLLANPDFNTLTQTKNNNGAGVQFNATTGNAEWVALPGTIKEMDAIQKICEVRNVAFTNVSATQATEEKFKSLSNHSPSILHLATHGFFLPDPKDKPNSVGENSYALADDPLLRSGIIMAGANKAWSGEQIPLGVDDGIATAYEIAQLDLSKTQLVTLSACETALGDLQGTEGVFGLQRAFKIAGVKNLIVSLWQVPDKETAELMTLFYSNLFVPNANVREAFNKAQREMRSKYPPFSWAAFVLVE